MTGEHGGVQAHQPKHILYERANSSKLSTKKDQFCRQTKKTKVKSYEPLDPQPEDIITLHRYYVKHSADPTYEKRVSRFEYRYAPETALYEYRGTERDLALTKHNREPQRDLA
ncbi:hypothetical protein BaRGS_00022526 [Batillaria attramentaria]|uniref:Uncharacterized protein n=1 Tax=Batillaria attramentaria TaxID=370345 RepID=A0ABD0KG39_9CAEN